MSMTPLQIGSFTIDQHSPVFIIAELSANHNGSLKTAIETIKGAKKTGANAIKIQTYTADTITLDSDRDDFKINQGSLWDGRYLHELYREAHTPWDWHEEIFRVAHEEGLVCFSSPFDPTAVELLESLNVPAYKIASFEITDIPLIKLVASKQKPVIISTGIALEEDIRLAIETCREAGNDKLILLKCTSSYPAPIEEANMAMIKDFSERFQVYSGLSDHTMGTTVPIVATAYGARVIEKHFIIDRSIGGPDAAFSLNQQEFSDMVKAVRDAEKAIGVVDYNLTPKQLKGRDFARSLYVVENVKRGDTVSPQNVRSIRPGYGMHPKYLDTIIGRTFSQDVEKGIPLNADHLN